MAFTVDPVFSQQIAGLVAKFQERAQGTDTRLNKALTLCALKVERTAKEDMSPPPSQPGQPPAVDTGRLRASITHRIEGNVAFVGTTVEYAAYLEYGTSRIEPRPFLHPALEKNDAYIREKLREVGSDRDIGGE